MRKVNNLVIELSYKLVIKVALSIRDSSSLMVMAMKANFNEFLQLVEDIIRLLAGEKGLVGELRVSGRLINAPPVGEATIAGDIHGDLESLKHILRDSGFVEKARGGEDVLLVFLGDYGDRGLYSPEVYYAVLKLKELFPKKVVLMRGNHEGPEDILAYPHDLPSQLYRKFGADGSRVYLKLRKLFNYLYNAVIVNERYVLLHGGVPSKASNMDDIAHAHEKHPRESHLEEILWSDPLENMRGTYPSPRGAGRLFGEDITRKLLEMLKVKALIRGHEPCEEGFRVNHGGKILTIFSRKGTPYHNERGAYLQLNVSEMVENAEQIKKYIRNF